MVDSVTLGKLVVQISADVADLKKGQADAGKLLQNLGRQSQASSRQIQTAFTGIVSRLGVMVGGLLTAQKAIQAFFKAVEDVNALGNLSAATGISVERLTELKFATESVGLEFVLLQQAALQLGTRLTEAVSNPAGRTAQALKALGLEARDSAGNIQRLDQLLPDVADAFEQYADGANKSALAAAIFGEEAGPKLIPLLNRGRAGIEELTQRARELGVTLDSEAIKRVNEFRTAQIQLTASLERLVQEFVTLAGPQIASAITNVTNLIRVLLSASQALNFEGGEQAAGGVIILQDKLKNATLRQLELADAANTWRSLLPGYQAEVAKVAAEIEKLSARFSELSGPLLSSSEVFKAPAPPIDIESLRQAQFELDQLLEKLMGNRTALDEMNLAWSDHASRVREAMSRVNAAYSTSAEQQRAMTRIKHQLAMKEQQDIESVAATAASTLTAVFQDNKLAAIGAAVINTALGITRALAQLNPPWSWIQAGLIAATGAAQIATIRSSSEKGGGSTPSVGGGGQQGQDDQQQDFGRSLHITGVDPAAFYSGKMLEELLGLINTEVKNGVRLISTRNLGF